MSTSYHLYNAPAIQDDYFYQFHIFKIISDLQESFDFENFVIFSEYSVDFKMLRVFGKPIICLSRLMLPEKKLRSIVNQKTLVLVYFEEEDSDYLNDIVNLNLRGMHGYNTVFIELNVTGYFDREEYFNFFTRRGFVNSVIIYRSQKGEHKIGRYCSYCNMLGDTFLDLSGTPANQMFPNVFKTATHLGISTVLNRNDIPRVFSVNGQIQGTSGRIFSAFLEHMNLEVIEIHYIGESTTFEFDRIISMIQSDFIEIAPYVATPYYEEEITVSYPLQIIEWRLMVPVENGIPRCQNIIYPFDGIVWFLIVLSVILAGCLLRLLSIRNPLMNSLALIMNISFSSFRDPSWRLFITYAILFVYGFIISNFYLSIMASILAKSIEGTQINTIHEILESRIPILITSKTKDFLWKSSPDFRLLEPNMLTVEDPDLFASKRNSFNTSYIYPVESDVWEFLNMRQQYLSHATFRLADITLIGSYGSLIMRNDSILERPLKTFIMDSYASGLMSYWKKETFLVAVKAQIIDIVKEYETILPLKLDYFFGLFGFLAFGCMAGVLSFFVEIITLRFK